MRRMKSGHVELDHMASHRLCLRFTFLGLVTLSVCSIVFIMIKGTRFFSLGSAIEIFDRNNVAVELRDLSPTNANDSHMYHPGRRTCNNTFDDILLVITFVESSYDSIPNLERLYRKRFPNILYCGPAKPRQESGYNIVVVAMLHGVTAYECLSNAIRTQTQFAGFLFVRNDLFVNFWNIESFDKSRIWEASDRLGNQVMFQQPRDSWIWWYTPWGLKACERAYRDVIYLNDVYKRALIDSKGEKEGSWDVEASLNALLWNGGGLYKCYRGRSDIFYVPAKYAIVFERLSAVFQKHQVYMEIAVPTIIRMLDLTERSLQLKGVDIAASYGEERAQKDDSLFWRHFVPNASYIRPILLRNTNSTKYKTNAFIEILFSRLNRVDCQLESNL